ncbi:MAG: NUDIX domain-containing protein [Candidatus Paceibacterota bacterium]|jgi:8-oxo-dGTP pyrophosphatase MutT (NUDIX family)
MNTEPQLLHEVAITAIVVKDGKYLITRRVMSKKRFPGKWTVPGGRITTDDYINLPKDTDECWYNVLERVVRREVTEEVGLEIKNIEYVTSLATIDKEGTPILIISCMADWAGGEVVLQTSETDEYAWVTLEEGKSYDLIGGIDEELQMADACRRGEKSEWKKAS